MIVAGNFLSRIRRGLYIRKASAKSEEEEQGCQKRRPWVQKLLCTFEHEPPFTRVCAQKGGRKARKRKAYHALPDSSLHGLTAVYPHRY